MAHVKANVEIYTKKNPRRTPAKEILKKIGSWWACYDDDIVIYILSRKQVVVIHPDSDNGDMSAVAPSAGSALPTALVRARVAYQEERRDFLTTVPSRSDDDVASLAVMEYFRYSLEAANVLQLKLQAVMH